MTATQTIQHIMTTRLVAIVRSTDADQAYEVSTRLLDLGVEVLEVALTTPGGLKAVERLAERDGALIGVGTCTDATMTRLAYEAGAKFAIAPTMSPDMVAAARSFGMAAIPAAMTPTEMALNLAAGADAVKLFPASVLGRAGLAAILEPLCHIPIVATGGVSVSDATDWIAAGAIAVGMGGALVRADDDDVRSLVVRLRQA